MSNKSHRLYTGSTTDLVRRAGQHKEGSYPNGFTARYKFDRLVYFEWAPDLAAAAMREKQIKAWTRAKRVALIQKGKPEPEGSQRYFRRFVANTLSRSLSTGDPSASLRSASG